MLYDHRGREIPAPAKRFGFIPSERSSPEEETDGPGADAESAKTVEPDEEEEMIQCRYRPC